MDPNPNLGYNYNYPARRESQLSRHGSPHPVPAPASASASATASAPARPDRSRSRGPPGANGRGGGTPIPMPLPPPSSSFSPASASSPGGPAILPPKSPRRPVSSNYAPSSSTASAADSSMSTVSSASTTILSPVPSSASSTLFSPRPASAMVPPTGCLPAASSFAASPSVAPSPMPMPRRSLPDVLSPPLDDAQLYPYLLRAALWHDRSKLSHGASLHGGGAMTTYVRQVFGVPNDKAKDPAYASVKNRSDDKHLYRDLNLYLDRLDLNLIPGRRHDDFPAPKSFSAWLNAERDAVISEARSLAARDSKVSKKSKHGTPNPRADTCLFIPPHADDAYATIVRKLANSSVTDPTSMGSAAWPTDEQARALLDLVATRWRIDPSYRSLLLLDRIATSQLITPPKTGGTCSPQSLRDIDTHLDQLMHLARTSVARWPTAHRAFAQRTVSRIAAAATDRIQHYPEFYQRVHFVPAMAGLVQMVAKCRLVLTQITADVAGPAPNVPDALPKLRHAAYVHFRRVLHKAHEESLAQLPEQQDDEAPPASDDPRLVLDRILLACEFVMHDVDKLKRVHASNSDTSNTALGWSAAHAVLTYELLSKLVAHIDEYWVKPQDGAAWAISKVFDVYNTVVHVVETTHKARESAMALGVVHMSGGAGRGAVNTFSKDSMSHLLSRYADWFQSAVDEWIRRTSETMTEQWTRRMIEQDQFVALNGPGTSSATSAQGSDGDMLSTSVIDLFSAFHQQVDALKALAWPSFDHEYRAAKKFTRTMCATLTRYADYIQGQVIAILLQMEEAALAEDAAIEAANSAGSGANSTHASPDRTKSLMHRLRGAFGGDKDKDRSVAGKVTRRIRTPTRFDEPLCVRLNNLYAAKRRIDGLYAHLTGVLSSELPEDLYVSPFARDETVVGMSQVYVELDRRAGGAAAGGPDVFWAEVTLDGTPLGRTPTEEGILRAAHHSNGSGRSGSPRATTPPPPVMIDLDSAVLVPGTSTVTVQLTVYASMLDGETVTSAIRSSTSMVPTSEERLGLAKGGLIVGMCNAAIDVRDVHSPEGVSKTYPVQLTGASQWATGKHHVGQRRLRVHVRWVRGESRYMYHFFDDAYSQLSVMVDNGLLMMASQVGKWMQDYMLQLVKQYKIASMAKAFGGGGEASTEYGGGESTIVSFKTRAGRKTITFATVEEDMQPLLDYLNHTLEVLNTHLHDSLTTKLFKRVWRGALTSIEWQLTGRRDKRTGKWKSLDFAQVAVLRRSLTLLYDFFHVDGEGLPRTLLQSRHYHRLAALLSYYHANTDDLMGMYLSAINSYLSAKVEGLTKRAQRQARSRQASTLTRGASLANFAKLADLSTGPQAASDVSPVHSPFASTKDINEVASTMARSGMTGLAPGKDVHVRERKFRTLRPGSARSGGGGGAVVSAKDFISALAADEPARKRAGAKERRFQGAVSKAMSDSESDDGSDHAFGDDDDDATSLGAPLYTDSGVGFGGSAGSRVVSPVDSEVAAAQAEFKLASLARQEAIWTILCLRADVGDLECRDFVTEQAAVVRRILDNMRDEATNMVASAGAGGSRVAGAARGGY